MSPLQETRIALRRLRRRPGETLIAVAALALGIGLTVTLFGIVHGSYLRSVPLPQPEGLVGFEYGAPRAEAPGDWVPFPVFQAWWERQRSFEDLAVFLPVNGNLSGVGGPAERRVIAFVSSNFFDLARVQPELGRGFRPDEERAGTPSVAVLSHRLWRERYGADPEILGRTVRVYGHPTTVIGVMPVGFQFPWSQDLWMPLGSWPGLPLESKEMGVFVFGRLAEGVSLESARVDIARIDWSLQGEMREVTRGRVGYPGSYRDTWFDRDDRRAHFLLLLVVTAVLLLACVNVASLLLARVVGRGRELAVRSALGAGRARIMALPMLEAALLTVAGGAAGLGLARVGLDLYARWGGNRTGAYWSRFELSGPVVLFALGVIALTVLATGLLPALRSARGRWAEQLKGPAGAPLDRRTGRWQRLLVGTQIALGAGLLVITALVVESLGNLDTGGIPDSGRVLTAQVTLFGADPPPPEARRARWRELEARLRADRPLQEASLSSGLPGTYIPESRAALPERPESSFPVRWVAATPDLFRVLGIPLLRGRGFEAGFTPVGGEPVVVVSRSFVARHFPGEDPLEKRLVLDPGEEGEQRARVIGVVGDVPMGRLEGDDDRRVVYSPWTDFAATSAWVAVRSEVNPAALGDRLREVVAELAPDQPVSYLQTLDGALAEAAFTYRFSGVLFLLFGAVALFLAALGLYAVMSFQVGRRTHEMGVRLAVGARRGDLLGLVLRGGLAQVVLGLVPGLVLGAVFTRLVTAFLYRVESAGIPSLAAVTLTLLGAGLLACWLPARRAARVDPMTALRTE